MVVQHWSLLVVQWSWVLTLRRRSLGELSLMDITWDREVSGSPVSWTWLSHLRGSGLTPGLSNKTVSATWLWEVWGLLPAFSRCSVGVVPHADVFLMYLWGRRWSPHLTPPPSWRSSLYLTAFTKLNALKVHDFILFYGWIIVYGIYWAGKNVCSDFSINGAEKPKLMLWPAIYV